MTTQSLIDYIWSLEGLGFVFAVLYLVLAIKQNVLCWYAGIVSTCIFLYLTFNANLYMEAALQVFYLGISFYGIWQWKYATQKRNSADKTPLQISSWNATQHFFTITLIVILALISGFILKTYTNAALPFIDSLTSWGGVVATYMVAKKVFENWHYWFVIDAISIYLYYERGFILYAFLFFIYLILIVFGYLTWRKHLQNDQ